jgi:hypothetical protein
VQRNRDGDRKRVEEEIQPANTSSHGPTTSNTKRVHEERLHAGGVQEHPRGQPHGASAGSRVEQQPLERQASCARAEPIIARRVDRHDHRAGGRPKHDGSRQGEDVGDRKVDWHSWDS